MLWQTTISPSHLKARLNPLINKGKSNLQVVRASLAVTGLRVITLLSKFILTFYLSRTLATSDLGVFALMITTVAIVIYLLGMEFYVYNLRELPGRTLFEQVCQLRDQVIFQLAVYLLILPLCWLVFTHKILPWSVLPWFYVLVITENISQEGYKVLLALSRPLVANIVLFFRTASWIYLLLIYGTLFHRAVALNTVWMAWLIGNACSLVLLVALLAKMPWRKAFGTSINWSKMFRGVKVSWIYMAILISYLATFYSGRYVLQAFAGDQMVGIFFFYVSVTAIVQTFTEAGAYVILQPRLIAAYRRGSFDQYRELFRQLTGGIIVTSLVVSLGLLATFRFILALMKKTTFDQYYYLFPILLVAVVIQCFSLIPHTALFVRGKDLQILAIQCFAMVFTIAANYFLIGRLQIIGAAYASLLSAAVLLVGKLLLCAAPSLRVREAGTLTT
jgi:O-antigen/teichoic acid export membrane protein